MQQNISQELLQYLKQQNLATPPVLPAMQQLRNNMDGLLARTELGQYEKARQYVQLQNKYLTFQHQLNSRNQEPNANREILTNSLTRNLPRSIQEPEISQPNSIQPQASDPSPCASGDTRDSSFSANGCASGDSTQSLASITPTRHFNTPSHSGNASSVKAKTETSTNSV